MPSSPRPHAGRRYVGRFAPSPTGPLHLGSVVAALASWLDARAAARQGWAAQWLVRIEDLDVQRCSQASAHTILRQLQDLLLLPDAPPQWQSQRTEGYVQALQGLREMGMAYACSCTRRQIEQAWQERGVHRQRFQTLPYPGTCRQRQQAGAVRVWRFLTEPAVAGAGDAGAVVHWHDRRLGAQSQDVAREVGDFALLRGDGIWSYQLGCVVDDADQGVTHIVRGEDLVDNTARQILLQRALARWAAQQRRMVGSAASAIARLDYATPVYLHIPLACDAQGEKLSKGNHAPSIDGQPPLQVLQRAAAVLGLPVAVGNHIGDALPQWVAAWTQRYPLD